MAKARLFSLLLVLAAAATCAHAGAFMLSVNFAPPSAQPGDPCFGTTCSLGGSVQFYLTVNGPFLDGPHTSLLGDPFAIDALLAGHSFNALFTPGDPCFGQDLTCTLGISFLDGGTTVGQPIPPPIFPTLFLADGSDIPPAYPNPRPSSRSASWAAISTRHRRPSSRAAPSSPMTTPSWSAPGRWNRCPSPLRPCSCSPAWERCSLAASGTDVSPRTEVLGTRSRKSTEPRRGDRI